VGLSAARKFACYKAGVNRALAGERKALAKWHGKKIAGVELVRRPGDFVSNVPLPSIRKVSAWLNWLGAGASKPAFIITGTPY
jgi:hypothetical protein